LHTKKHDYYLLTLSRKHSIAQLAIYADKNNLFYIKEIYSYHTGREIPRDETKYFHIPGKNILIIFFNTSFPHKGDFRRIVAFDTENLKVLWEKFTPDYTYDFIYSKAKPGSFYYSTISYANGLFYSRGAFYRVAPNSKKIFLDTTISATAPKTLDTTSSDYASDVNTYIVELSLEKGKELWRKKMAGAFHACDFQKHFIDTNTYFTLFNRSEHSSQLYTLNVINNSIKKTDLKFTSTVNAGYRNPFWTNDFLLFFGNDTLHVHKLTNGTAKHTKTIIGNTFYFGEKINNYILMSNRKTIFIFNKNLDLLGKAENKNCRYVWSPTYNAIIATPYTQDHSYILRMIKLSWLERISPKLMNYLFASALIIIFVLIITWALTMWISSQKLKRKNKELEETTVKLIRTEKLALLGTIAASFAHQLNSPLGAILNSAERLSSRSDDKNIDLIKRSAEYSKTLVQKFLETSPGKATEENPCTNFAETWNDWLALFEEEASKRKIEIITEFREVASKIKIARSELFEIISNIMFNARDSILASNKDKKFIKISTEKRNNSFVVKIEDSGTGFNEQQLDKIFEPFYSTKQKGKGTGLGLWIVKKLLERNNAKIELANTPNGAKIILYFEICKNKGDTGNG
jgi:signal transduction histidine kinase